MTARTLGIVLSASLLGMSGCTTLTSFNQPVPVSKTLYLTVDSEPSDAEVYLNDRLVGRTPCSVPLVATFSQTRSQIGALVGTFEDYLTQQYFLRVSKAGYKDAIRSVEFSRKSDYLGDAVFNTRTTYELASSRYSFRLIPISGQSADLPASAPSPTSLIGRVTQVNRDFDFVIVDLGANHGIAPGQELEVVREQGVVARVRVEKVQENLSSATPLPGSDKATIQEGDVVRVR